MNILQLENVSFVYGAGTPFERIALNNVSLGFERGKITGLIGKTGSGKSTLVSMLNGLLRPTSGKVLFNGADIWEKPREIGKIRYKVGLVMQYPEYQLFDETVRLDLGFAPRNLGLSAAEIETRVNTAVEYTGIHEDLLDKSPFELSGGEKRRVAIAGVLAMEPDVLILDEPAAGLDPRGRREILGGLSRLVKERGTTVILVSHSMEDMALYCDNVAVMYNAELFAEGRVSDIFSDTERLESVGLDAPAVSKIANKLISRGIPLTGELYTVAGVKAAIIDYIGRCKK